MIIQAPNRADRTLSGARGTFCGVFPRNAPSQKELADLAEMSLTEEFIVKNAVRVNQNGDCENKGEISQEPQHAVVDFLIPELKYSCHMLKFEKFNDHIVVERSISG